MLKKCEHCNERVRFWALHNRECKKRRAFLKSQSKVVAEDAPIREVEKEEVFNAPLVEVHKVQIQQKPKKQYTKKVKP